MMPERDALQPEAEKPSAAGFEDELRRALDDGVAGADDLPFLLEPPAPPKAGVLLVHGLAATPWEMRPVGEALTRAGFVSLGVRLPGHGTTPGDLAARRCEEWLAAVERGRRLLAGRGLRVYGAGQSTGALLLLALAAEAELAGLVLFSPFLRLRHPLAPLVGLLRHLLPAYRPPEAATPHYYGHRPLAAVHQLNRLAARVRRALPALTLPVLALGADADLTARPDSGRDLVRRLGSRRKEYRRLGPQVPHVLTTAENPRQRQTLALAVEFLLTLEREAPRP
jgi:carboxylesterase